MKNMSASLILFERIKSTKTASHLAAEAVKGASLALQSVNDVHGGHRLTLGVFGIGDSITNDVLKKYLRWENLCI